MLAVATVELATVVMVALMKIGAGEMPSSSLVDSFCG